MSLTIVTRAAAGLPPVPSSVGHRSPTGWTGIKVHHTGGAFSSWRAIYDWQVLNRPPGQRLVDIGYSFGVAQGQVTQLRGWDRAPAHDHQNTTLGVVFGGNYQSGLPPAADLAAFVEFCRLARERTGRRLEVTGHRDTWPRGDRRYSTCPGDALYAHLPALRERVDQEEGDVSAEQVWGYREPSRPKSKMTMGQRVVDTEAKAGAAARAAEQLLAGQAAIVARLGGEDPGPVVRAELDRHRQLTVAAVGAEFDARLAAMAPALAAAVAEQVPGLTAEQLAGPVAEGLRIVLREGVGPADEDGGEPNDGG